MNILERFPSPFPPLVKHYLDGGFTALDIHAFPPTKEGLQQAYHHRVDNPPDRELLVRALLRQTQRSTFATDYTRAQIDRLLDPKMVTITTGHQLCLYGGPLFFISKIATVIRLCRELKKDGMEAVPVFWMASEDHDFEEINHIHIQGQRIEWKGDYPKGGVGRIRLSHMESFRAGVRQALTSVPEAQEWLQELERIYADGALLADATRDFVYRLFAQEGIVVLDGDDAELKRALIPVVRKELETQFCESAVLKQNARLETCGFKPQATVRPINLFWLDEQVRGRIEHDEEGFFVRETALRWTEKELLAMVESNPERFSPNVLLRPVYQECILPNIAYVGGPGEVSYWLQLKSVFDACQVQMPVVWPRASLTVASAAVQKRVRALGLAYADLNTHKEDVFAKLVRSKGTHEDLVAHTRLEVEEKMLKLIEELKRLDPGLGRSAQAEQQRMNKRLEALTKKTFRHDKRQAQDIAQRLDVVFSELFPSSQPQERIENFLRFPSLAMEAVNAIEVIPCGTTTVIAL